MSRCSFKLEIEDTKEPDGNPAEVPNTRPPNPYAMTDFRHKDRTGHTHQALDQSHPHSSHNSHRKRHAGSHVRLTRPARKLSVSVCRVRPWNAPDAGHHH